MNCTFCLVRFSNSTPVTFAAAFWLTKLILPGFSFIHVDQFAKRVRRQVVLGDHELGIVRNQRDRLEILLEIVVELVDDAADMGVPLADVEGVAIGRGARDAPDTDAAAGAADIFDHDGLPERCAHPLGHDPRGGIGRSARRERHHQRDGARGIGLRLRRRGAEEDQE